MEVYDTLYKPKKKSEKVEKILNYDKVKRKWKRLTSFLWKQHSKNLQSKVTYDQIFENAGTLNLCGKFSA